MLLNNAPLQLAPLYAAQSNGGAGDNPYWQNKTSGGYNQTEYQYKMLEYTQLNSRLFEYGVAYETLAKARWPGATFDILDVNSLLSNMYHNPSQYLESPANATGYYYHCEANNSSICTTSSQPLDTFLWFDPLHPSNKTHTMIAREFVNLIAGNSSYGIHVE